MASALVAAGAMAATAAARAALSSSSAASATDAEGNDNAASLFQGAASTPTALDFVLQPVEYSSVEVSRGAQFEVVLPVSAHNVGDAIVWKFETEQHDIAFSVRFTTVLDDLKRPGGQSGAVVDTEVEPLTRHADSCLKPVQGVYTVEYPGTLTLVWDNSHSLIRPKTLRYAAEFVARAVWSTALQAAEDVAALETEPETQMEDGNSIGGVSSASTVVRADDHERANESEAAGQSNGAEAKAIAPPQKSSSYETLDHVTGSVQGSCSDTDGDLMSDADSGSDTELDPALLGGIISGDAAAGGGTRALLQRTARTLSGATGSVSAALGDGLGTVVGGVRRLVIGDTSLATAGADSVRPAPANEENAEEGWQENENENEMIVSTELEALLSQRVEELEDQLGEMTARRDQVLAEMTVLRAETVLHRSDQAQLNGSSNDEGTDGSSSSRNSVACEGNGRSAKAAADAEADAEAAAFAEAGHAQRVTELETELKRARHAAELLRAEAHAAKMVQADRAAEREAVERAASAAAAALEHERTQRREAEAAAAKAEQRALEAQDKLHRGPLEIEAGSPAKATEADHNQDLGLMMQYQHVRQQWGREKSLLLARLQKLSAQRRLLAVQLKRAMKKQAKLAQAMPHVVREHEDTIEGDEGASSEVSAKELRKLLQQQSTELQAARQDALEARMVCRSVSARLSKMRRERDALARQIPFDRLAAKDRDPVIAVADNTTTGEESTGLTEQGGNTPAVSSKADNNTIANGQNNLATEIGDDTTLSIATPAAVADCLPSDIINEKQPPKLLGPAELALLSGKANPSPRTDAAERQLSSDISGSLGNTNVQTSEMHTESVNLETASEEAGDTSSGAANSEGNSTVAGSRVPAPQDRWRAQLIAFYAEHNPAKLDQVDHILMKHAGREENLFAMLHHKYPGAQAIAASSSAMPPPQQPLQTSTGDAAPAVTARATASGKTAL